MKRMRASTHAFGRVLLKRPEKPLRALTIGKYIVMWDGKPGDYRETITAEELFGTTPATTSDSHPGATL